MSLLPSLSGSRRRRPGAGLVSSLPHWVLLALLLAAAVVDVAHADDHTHRYKEDEEVTVWVNRVGPYHNPQETYDYYALPLCVPKIKTSKHKSNTLGVVLEGDELTDTGIHVNFLSTYRKPPSTARCLWACRRG